MSTIDEGEAIIADLCAIAEPLTPDGEVFRAIYWAIDVIQRQSAALSAEKAAREEAERERDEAQAKWAKADASAMVLAMSRIAAEAETARLRERVKEMEEMISNPAAVRINILCGTIAKPTDLVFLHDTNGPVAERVKAAFAEEREACAKIAEGGKGYLWNVRAEIAYAIRSRENSNAE